MKIIITGASGSVGRLLIPEIAKNGHELLLVGRNLKKLKFYFPKLKSTDYNKLPSIGQGFDLLIHLAISNNNSIISDEEFYDVNVKFLLDIVHISKEIGVKKFINFSSLHSLDNENQSTYAKSKRKGTKELNNIKDLNIETWILPYVYGRMWHSKLAFLNKLPLPFARAIFLPLAAMKPTVHINKIVLAIEEITFDCCSNDVILSDEQKNNWIYKTIVRSIDLIFSITVIFFLWWLFAIVWLVIRFESKGSSFFKQKRVGKNTQLFTCVKFRTMALGTEQVATHEVNSASLTRVGLILRKTKIDELPQVWNVLKNEMSLVGPRPCLPSQDELISERNKKNVLSIKPGITGLSQIQNIDMSTPIKLAQKDSEYLALRSLLLDLKILLKTATGSGQGDKTNKNII